MCHIFYNNYVKWGFLLTLVVYSLQSLWGNATVAASAWSANIPFNTATLKMCSLGDFSNDFIPPDPECANAYRLCVCIFGVIVIALSLIELTDQVTIQLTVGAMRFVMLGCMVVFCVVRLIENNGLPPHFENSTVISCNSSSSNATLGEALYQFNFKPWLVSIPIFVYAQVTHMGVVTLSGPMKSKQYLKEFFIFLLSSTFLIYCFVAVAVAMYFQYCVSNMASLNWLPWIEMDASLPLKMLSYYVILFPTVDVMTAYSLSTAATANNVYLILSGKDSTNDARQYARVVLLLLKFVSAILPLSLAFAVSNLLYVNQYSGLTTFLICHLFPALFQLGSQYHCMKEFGDSPSSTATSDEGTSLIEKHVKTKSLLKNWWLTWKNPAYWTPHSTFISHPISVSIICVICLILFGLSVGSLFVNV